MPLFKFHHSEVHNKKKQFEWGEPLGRGTFGEVTRCVWTTHKPPIEVAMKVVMKSKISYPEKQVEGMTILTSNDHPHVVKLYEWFESKGHYYMPFQLASGGELYDQLEHHKHFPESVAKPMMVSLLQAVQYVHGRDIIHRDIKLENIFLRDRTDEPPYHCMLADFGVCKVNYGKNPKEIDRLTDICGSSGYMAPEVVKRTGYGMAVDIWSLGIVAFLLLGGRFPFKADMNEEFVAQAEGGVRFIGPVWEDVSDSAKDFIKACLEFDPKNRLTLSEALQHRWLVTPRAPLTAPTPVITRSMLRPEMEPEDEGDPLAKQITQAQEGEIRVH